MELINVFGQLSIIVQLALIIGSVVVIFLIACSRQAAENLALFIRELRVTERSPKHRIQKRQIR